MNKPVMDNYFREQPAFHCSGWLVLLVWFLLLAVLLLAGFDGLQHGKPPLLAVLLLGLLLLVSRGFVIIAPNLAAVLTFFGKYAGTIAHDGFFWCNPLASRSIISLRINNFTTETIKVNDKNGNPIEIAAVISWRIQDSAKAVFAVNDCNSYVQMACESAIREVASGRVYDHSIDESEQGKTLRGDLEGVAKELVQKVEEHVYIAGIAIISAKITHLAYAPEIAMAMLRRQQATAVVAARKQIVAGAVGMVKDALEEIRQQNIVQLSEPDKAALVANLLTVLVSETETQPVIALNK